MKKKKEKESVVGEEEKKDATVSERIYFAWVGPLIRTT